MTSKSTENRRSIERRVDKMTMKTRMIVGTLKRTIGASAARRYLEKNGYSDEVIHDMMLSSIERRALHRRTDNRPSRFQQASIRIIREDESFSSLTAEEIKLLYGLCTANDSEGVFIRMCDLPAKFARFGLVVQGTRGARITLRGRTALRHWSRARTLYAISLGKGTGPYEDAAHTWLRNNRFIDILDTGLGATPRGLEWLEPRRKILNELEELFTSRQSVA